MSDDEYYGEYDDFEDGLWDTDPAPDLADDLAEHTAYSPVWHDDPVGELDPYHSDWEYYSDDYYDDDPGLKQDTLDGTTSAPTTMVNTRGSKRGKKRKLDEAREPTIVKRGSLIDCIRGTVWAQEEQHNHVAFRPGQHQSVALLKNWKELFKSEEGLLHTFGKGQLQLDESWANDLSLADMGLLNDMEKSGVRENAAIDEEQESDLVDIEEAIHDIDDMDTVEHYEPPIGLSKSYLKDSDRTDPFGSGYDRESDPGHEPDDLSNPSKRRKFAGQSSPLEAAPKPSTGVAGSKGLTQVPGDATIKKQSSRPAHNTSDNTHAVNAKNPPAALTKENHRPLSRSKKRKLSPEASESMSLADIGNESRPKRVAAERRVHEQPTIGKAAQSASRLPKSQGK